MQPGWVWPDGRMLMVLYDLNLLYHHQAVDVAVLVGCEAVSVRVVYRDQLCGSVPSCG